MPGAIAVDESISDFMSLSSMTLYQSIWDVMWIMINVMITMILIHDNSDDSLKFCCLNSLFNRMYSITTYLSISDATLYLL